MLVKLNEKEYRVLKRVLREATNSDNDPDDFDIADVVSDFQDYLRIYKISATNRKDLKAAFERYLVFSGHKELIHTSLPDRVMFYLDDEI